MDLAKTLTTIGQEREQAARLLGSLPTGYGCCLSLSAL
jgi:hypothetical protein